MLRSASLRTLAQDSALARARKLLLVLVLLLASAPATAQVNCGDCDGNMIWVTILDALRGAQFAAGLVPPGPPSPTDLVVCDVDASGSISVLDALLMAQEAAGLPVTLVCPISCGSNAPLVDANYLPLQTASPPRCADLAVDFTLTDADSDPCDVTVEFSTDAGSTWSPCTEAVGSSGTTGLTSSPTGVTHTFIWDSLTDLGMVRLMNVQMRMSVVDCATAGNTDRSLPGFTVGNDNSQPIVGMQGVAPPYPLHGNLLIDYFLFDNDADVCELVPEASTDGGATWQPAAQGPGGDGVTGLASATIGVSHTFDWDVDATYSPPGWFATQIQLRLTPVDCGNGIPDTRVFPGGAGCQPSQVPPTVAVTTSLQSMVFPGFVPFDFDVTDANSDLVDVVILYSTDNGISFPPSQVCTQASGDPLTDIPATPMGVSRNFEWDAFADLGTGIHQNLRLRLSPQDFCGPGMDVIAPDLAQPPFEVGCPPGTSAPTVSVITPLSGNTFSGAVNIDFNVIDADSHPVDVQVDYSTDNGTTWSLATLVSGGNPLVSLTSSPGGSMTSIMWDTSVDLPGVTANTCRLRFGMIQDFCDMGVDVIAPPFGMNPFIIDNAVAGFGPGVFVCHSGTSRVFWISNAAPTMVAPIGTMPGQGSIQLPPGASPFDAVIDPVTQNRLYVLGENAIYIIDANTHQIIDADPGGGGASDPISPSIMSGIPCSSFSPQQMEISPDGQHLYINVFACNMRFNLMKVSTSGPPYNVVWSIDEGLFPDVQGEFALSPNGQRIVTMNNNNYDTDCGVASGCPQLMAAGCVGLGCILFPQFVDCCNTDSVSFVNATTGTIINSIDNMGNNPLWGAFNDTGTRCYVSEFGYLDLCQDAIFCDVLGEEIHIYDTSGATMTSMGAVQVPCPACGVGGSTIQEGSFPAGVFKVPGRDLLYITDPANEAGNMAIFNTATNMFESTAGLPLQYYAPMMTGSLFLGPHHVTFDSVRNHAYVIEFDQVQARVRTINTAASTFGAIDTSRDQPFGAFPPGALSGLAAKE